MLLWNFLGLLILFAVLGWYEVYPLVRKGWTRELWAFGIFYGLAVVTTFLVVFGAF